MPSRDRRAAWACCPPTAPCGLDSVTVPYTKGPRKVSTPCVLGNREPDLGLWGLSVARELPLARQLWSESPWGAGRRTARMRAPSWESSGPRRSSSAVGAQTPRPDTEVGQERPEGAAPLQP